MPSCWVHNKQLGTLAQTLKKCSCNQRLLLCHTIKKRGKKINVAQRIVFDII